MKLYTFHTNSAGERVRIALHLKGVDYEYVSLPSIPRGTFRQLNPQGLIPMLDVEGRAIAQSTAILHHLEHAWPDPPLLPADPVLRGQVLAFSGYVAAEMHAVGTRRIRRYLATLGVTEPGVEQWQHHWLTEGFAALETTLAQRERPTPFCFGEAPGWADLHLVPQLRKARRVGFDPEPYRRLLEVEQACLEVSAFVQAGPEHQPDWPGASRAD